MNKWFLVAMVGICLALNEGCASSTQSTSDRSVSAAMPYLHYGPEGGLPPDYKWEENTGPDFVVHYAHAGADSPGRVIVYLGMHPDFKPNEKPVTRPGKIGDLTVTWHLSTTKDDDGQVLYIRDAVASVSGGVIHANVASTTEAETSRLCAELVNLRLYQITNRTFPQLREDLETQLQVAETKFLAGFFPQKTREEMSEADQKRLRHQKYMILARTMGTDWANLFSRHFLD